MKNFLKKSEKMLKNQSTQVENTLSSDMISIMIWLLLLREMHEEQEYDLISSSRNKPYLKQRMNISKRIQNPPSFPILPTEYDWNKTILIRFIETLPIFSSERIFVEELLPHMSHFEPSFQKIISKNENS
jgi:hypothetical protein